jgi:hypothetical protein
VGNDPVDDHPEGDHRQHGGGDPHTPPALTLRNPHGASGVQTIAAGPNSEAAASADSRSANNPKAVGPEPLINARAAPAARSASSESPILGRSANAAGSRSLTSIAQALLELLELGGLAPEPDVVGLRVHVRGREALRIGQQNDRMLARRRKRLYLLAGAADQREGRTQLGGDVGAQLGGRLLDAFDLTFGEPQHRRRVGAATAQPAGNRDSLRDLDPDRRMLPTAFAERLQGCRGEVLSAHLRADHLVAGRLGHVELVGQRDRLEQRANLVQAVVAWRPDEQAEVELGGGGKDQVAGR